ncbi:MAG: hypothetical protein ACFFDF_03630 [Candidatus Odinarchaeota archaeon]
MKSVKRTLLIILCILFISISSTTNALGAKYSYNVKKGEEYIWTVMVGNPSVYLDQGSKFRVNIEKIYNGTWIEDSSSYFGTILNYSIEVYSTYYSFPEWDLFFNGSAMFFNDSTWNLFTVFTTDLHIALLGFLFFVPIPLNLTWIGNYLIQTSSILFTDYSINGNTLIMQNLTSNIDFAFTFNNNGTLTEYKVSSGSSIGYYLKYGNISIPNQIPFGNYYLIFIPCTIIIIIAFNRYKFKRKKDF